MESGVVDSDDTGEISSVVGCESRGGSLLFGFWMKYGLGSRRRKMGEGGVWMETV